MAELTLTDAYLSVAANDVSSWVTSITISHTANIQENTAMGSTFISRIGGLQDWSVSVEFNQDYAASNLDSILSPLVNTSVALVIRPTSGAVSTSNPEWTGNAFLESYEPIGGSVGDVATAPVNFVGNGTLTRATA